MPPTHQALISAFRDMCNWKPHDRNPHPSQAHTSRVSQLLGNACLGGGHPPLPLSQLHQKTSTSFFLFPFAPPHPGLAYPSLEFLLIRPEPNALPAKGETDILFSLRVLYSLTETNGRDGSSSPAIQTPLWLSSQSPQPSETSLPRPWSCPGCRRANASRSPLPVPYARASAKAGEEDQGYSHLLPPQGRLPDLRRRPIPRLPSCHLGLKLWPGKGQPRLLRAAYRHDLRPLLLLHDPAGMGPLRFLLPRLHPISSKSSAPSSSVYCCHVLAVYINVLGQPTKKTIC